MNEFIAIRVDEENSAEAWWAALETAYPRFCDSLRSNFVAVISADLWNDLSELDGFNDGPEFARTALLDLGSDGDQFADVVARRHSVFDELS